MCVSYNRPILIFLQIHENITNSRLLVVTGGPHICFLKGYTCVDNLVVRFLLGETEHSETYLCNAEVPIRNIFGLIFQMLTEYTPVSPRDVVDVATALDAMFFIDIELHHLPECFLSITSCLLTF